MLVFGWHPLRRNGRTTRLLGAWVRMFLLKTLFDLFGFFSCFPRFFSRIYLVELISLIPLNVTNRYSFILVVIAGVLATPLGIMIYIRSKDEGTKLLLRAAP